MAKINITKSGLGVRGVRVIVGIPGHRPSAFSSCIGATMKGMTFPTPPPGFGGKNNACVRLAFVQANVTCGGNVGTGVVARLQAACTNSPAVAGTAA